MTEEKKDNAGDVVQLDSSPPSSNPPSKSGPKDEILYNKGATELFLHIEECDWEQAYKSFEKDSEAVKIWVKKTKSEGTHTFGWGIWRRLPIHEACRRQPPAWLISSLLSAHPESATLKNDFGQMPLHVAVECGATPEVINLLLLSNWHAIRVEDNSGRTALQILEEGQETSVLMQDDIQVVRECLQRSYDALLSIERSWKKRWDQREMQHKEQLGAVKKVHDQAIIVEKNVQMKIKNDLESKKNIIDGLKSDRFQLEKIIQEKSEKEKIFTREIEKRDTQIEDLQEMQENLQGEMQSFQKSMAEKDKTVRRLKKNIQTLSNDLAQITIDHDDQLIVSAYSQLDADMKALRRSQKLMAKQLSTQSKGLHGILKARGIKLAPQEDETDMKNEQVATVPEEEVVEEVKPMNTAEVVNNIATAALAALQGAEQEGLDSEDYE
mmetsp:Transcript_7720/g.11098  ORF Transcript_7720/g.11098 Transcript_7720/m.11098 type:complete len:439 (-) Transcript_7720:71-1387(-)